MDEKNDIKNDTSQESYYNIEKEIDRELERERPTKKEAALETRNNYRTLLPVSIAYCAFGILLVVGGISLIFGSPLIALCLLAVGFVTLFIMVRRIVAMSAWLYENRRKD